MASAFGDDNGTTDNSRSLISEESGIITSADTDVNPGADKPEYDSSLSPESLAFAGNSEQNSGVTQDVTQVLDITEHETSAEGEHSAEEVRLLSSRRVKFTPSVDRVTILECIEEEKAEGRESSLWLRQRFQRHLFVTGCFVHRNAGKVLFVALVLMAALCVAIKSSTIEYNIERLWVQDGGRLSRELEYVRSTIGEGVGTSNQLVIQTPRDGTATNVLRAEALLAHLDITRVALDVAVDLYDVSWRLKDLCYAPSVPMFEEEYIDSIFEGIMPCTIITPLDCFWEGSKLLGPEFPVRIPNMNSDVHWTNLNPQSLIELFKGDSFSSGFPFRKLEGFMKNAGITTGYQEKPCLNPKDSQCPETAPNKKTKQSPDIAANLNGGCYGFATKFMHWPQDLIVGGSKQNRTGHLLRAEALQTVVQLMAESELYSFHRDTYKVHSIDWSVDKAKQVLVAWQRKFAQEILKASRELNSTKRFEFSVFTSSALTDIMRDFSELNVPKVVLGYIFMTVYVCVSLVNCIDGVRSQAGVGFAGVVLVALGIAAGFGVCSLLSLPLNATSTQVLPFLALALGLDGIYLMIHFHAKISRSNVSYENQTGECLKRVGLSVTLSSTCTIFAFLAAAIVPIPALRSFCLQAAVLLAINFLVVVLVFPAVLSIDMRRRSANRIDILCCIKQRGVVKSANEGDNIRSRSDSLSRLLTATTPRITEHGVPDAELGRGGGDDIWVKNVPQSEATTLQHEDQQATKNNAENDVQEYFMRLRRCCGPQGPCQGLSLTHFAVKHFAPFLLRTPTKVVTVLVFVVALTFGIWGASRMEEGLHLTDLVPRHTAEYAFLVAQRKFFSFYNMFAVTQGNFEYPTNQRLLYEYHDAFTRIDAIIKNDDGGLPDFWLAIFRDWLVGLQAAFDRDWKGGCITPERWYNNASDEGILAYKLLVQTGRVDHPIDKSQVNSIRLVNVDGIINQRAFYNYLTAWTSNDDLAFAASMAHFHPEPKKWLHDPSDTQLKIPKSAAIVYAQMPFYLHNLRTTRDITRTIENIRAICERFETRGLPNFPSGIPFVFWEQYMGLKLYFVVALAALLVFIFSLMCGVFLDFWTASFVVLFVVAMLLQLLGVLALCGVNFSAVSVTLMVISAGIVTRFMVHLMVSFVTALGSKTRRAGMAVEYMFSPSLHASLASTIALSILTTSEFDFIIKQFFYILIALVVLGAINGLWFLPVLLSAMGPSPDLIPKGGSIDHIDPPTPPASPQVPRRSQRSRSSRHSSRSGVPASDPTPGRLSGQGVPSLGRAPSFRSSSTRGGGIYPGCRSHSDLSLSTIPEESRSHMSSPTSSHHGSILVSPEVVLETTTITNTTSSAGNCTHTQTTTTQNGSDTSGDNATNTGGNPSPTPSSASSSGISEGITTPSPKPTVVVTTSDAGSAPTTNVTTTKVTAKVKLELHAPYDRKSSRSSRHSRSQCSNRHYSQDTRSHRT